MRQRWQGRGHQARSLAEQLVLFSSSWEQPDLSPLGLPVPTVLQGEQSDAWEAGRGGKSSQGAPLRTS